MREETFGPTLPIMKVRRRGRGRAAGQRLPVRAGAAVYTRDLERGEAVARRLESGAVCVNDALLNYYALELPMGGAKASGMGYRHGPAASASSPAPGAAALPLPPAPRRPHVPLPRADEPASAARHAAPVRTRQARLSGRAESRRPPRRLGGARARRPRAAAAARRHDRRRALRAARERCVRRRAPCRAPRQASFYGGLVLIVATLDDDRQPERRALRGAHGRAPADRRPRRAAARPRADRAASWRRCCAIRFFDRLRILAHPLVALPLWAIDLYLWHLAAPARGRGPPRRASTRCSTCASSSSARTCGWRCSARCPSRRGSATSPSSSTSSPCG